MIYLIPSYRPGPTLPTLVRSLLNADPGADVVVVDDGSGPGHREVFHAVSEVGGRVLRHAQNCGKGAALKTGFAFIARRHPGRPVVTADADGQHLVVDIVAVGRRVGGTSRTQVLGSRSFGPDVPLRSRFGNAMTGVLFRLATGRGLPDTQTGLRGFSADLLPWLQQVPGDRYEYELQLLLRARSASVHLVTVPISTVYLDGNASSHFRPIIDSARIYWPLLKFAGSSLVAFCLDLIALLLLQALTGSLLVAAVGARLISSTANFAINRSLVFGPQEGRRPSLRASAVRYFALAMGILSANYLLLLALTGIGVALLPAKVGTELILFGVSFVVQRASVFRTRRARSSAGEAAGERAGESGGDAPPVRLLAHERALVAQLDRAADF